MKKKGEFFFLITIVVIAFLYRFRGIFLNYPFWIDEFDTANQARNIINYGLSIFTTNNHHLEHNNLIPHLLVALFFKIFGQQEWVARIPFIIIGSFVPVAVYFVTRSISKISTAISAALFTTFLYFEILWSRQARGYVLLQLTVLSLFYAYFQLISHKAQKQLWFGVFIAALTIGMLTHNMFILAVLSVCLHFVVLNRKTIFTFLKKPWIYILVSVISVLAFIQFIPAFFTFLSNGMLGANNLWYYHSFLWREYALISFLGVIGLLINFQYKKKEVSLIMMYMFMQFIFVSFVFGHYMTKYIATLFPFLLIGMAYTIQIISEKLLSFEYKNIYFSRLKIALPVFISLAIIANGHKFVTKPKLYYSINRDFREIANIDYHAIFDIIKSKGELDKNMTAVIDTWPDRSYWYLGLDYKNIYLLRWQNEPGAVSGHVRKTEFTYNNDGEKVAAYNVRFIGEVADLKRTMKKYPKGFIFIDDATMPKDVIDYAEKNLKKEMYLDHYTLDDNPYSIWPATLYSWGVE